MKDRVRDYLADQEGRNIDEFVVAGGLHRGCHEATGATDTGRLWREHLRKLSRDRSH